MYVAVALVVLMVVTCNHASPAVTRLQVNRLPIDIENVKQAQDYKPAKGFTTFRSGLARSIDADVNMNKDTIFKLMEGAIALSALEKMLTLYNSLDNEVTEDVAYENYLSDDDDNGYYPGQRGKRAIGSIRRIISLGTGYLKGLRARKTLLSEARPFRVNGKNVHYEKSGDAKKMIKDFYSVKPANVRKDIIDGHPVGMIGEVGDSTIHYFRYNADHVEIRPLLTITRTNRNGDVVKDVIHYMN